MRAEPLLPEWPGAPRTPAAHSWTVAFERALQAVYGIVCALTVVHAVLLVRQQQAAVGPAVLPVAASLATVVVSAVWLWRRGPAVAIFWTCWPTFLACQWWCLQVAPGASVSGTWWAWQPCVTLAALLGGTAAPRRVAVGMVVFTTGVVLVRPPTMAGGRQLLTELLTCWQCAFFAALVVVAWRRIAHAADVAAAQEVRQAGRAAAVRAVDDLEQRAARSLHDQVLHALRAIADGAGGRRDLVLQLTASAAGVFRSAPGRPAASVDGVRCQLREVALGSEMSVAVTGIDIELPGEVVDAVVTAAGEALRNVQRHSGVDRAEIEIRALPGGGATIRIADKGRGLDASTIPASAKGISHSIIAVMSAIGGSARVDSRPGGGTVVILEWSAPFPGATESMTVTTADLMVEWAGARRAMLAGCVLTESVGGTIHSVLWIPVLGFPLLGSIAVVMGVLAIVACGRRVWTGGAFTVVQSVAVGLVSCCCVALGGLALGRDGGGLDLGVVEVVAPLFMMLAWRGSRTAALVMAICAAAVTATAAATTPIGVAGFFPMVTLFPLTVGMVLVMRYVVGRSGLRVEAALMAERAATAVAEDARIQQTARATRLDRLRPLVLPLLDAVVSGSAGLEDPAVGVAAGVVSAAVRDDLCLGAELSARSRALLAAARRAGCRVDVHGGDGEFPGIGETVEALLEVGLDGDLVPESAVLTVQRDPAGTVVASLLTRPAVPALQRVCGQISVIPAMTEAGGAVPGVASVVPTVASLLPAPRDGQPAGDPGFTLWRLPQGGRDVVAAGSSLQ